VLGALAIFDDDRRTAAGAGLHCDLEDVHSALL
jgi:hypothetical protein